MERPSESSKNPIGDIVFMCDMCLDRQCIMNRLTLTTYTGISKICI